MAVTLVATALAITTGRNAAGVALVAAAVLAGQLSVGWLNDALDATRDHAVGRTDKPVAAGAVSPPTVRTAALVAALACVPLSLASGLLAGCVHLIGVAAGWAYDLGFKSTPLSVLPYLVGFGLLPVFVVLGLPGTRLPPWWLPVGAGVARVPERTSRTCCPTSTTTPPPGCVACRTGSVRSGARLPRRC